MSAALQAVSAQLSPALSLLLWILIAWQALSGRIPSPFTSRSSFHEKPYDWHHLNAWEWIYIIYSVAAHVSACLIFPARLCWSTWHMVDEIRLAKYDAAEVSRPYADSEAASSIDDKASLMSLSAASSASATPEAPLSRASTPSSKVGAAGGYEDADTVIHAIIIPNYKEDMDTMRETLAVLASHVLAKSSYDVSRKCHTCHIRFPKVEGRWKRRVSTLET